MAKRISPDAPPRIPLSRERVLRAAIAVADSGGIETLTMRNLAEKLRVEAMSLYYHVANKDDILNGIIDIVASEVVVPTLSEDWKSNIRRSSISAHEVLKRHPWAAALWLSTTSPGPGRLRYMDSILGGLRTAGFSRELTHHAFHSVENHILGYSLQEASVSFDSDVDMDELGASFLQSLPVDEYPHLAEHVTYHLETGLYDEGDFEFGLDLILHGIERILAASSVSSG
jgi:AcrR family transcriptional regulator